jgi:hypothetical protein
MFREDGDSDEAGPLKWAQTKYLAEQLYSDSIFGKMALQL